MADMDFEQFENSLAGKTPPRGAGGLLQALWHDANGDWAKAHALVQKEGGRLAAAVHAYLHRKEGDLSNAGYWYQRAGRTRPATRLTTEWNALVRELLEAGG
jgi:hypothetical protein